MPPIKILHLITSLDRGGAQTMLARLAAHMDRSCFESVVVTLLSGGVHEAELRAAGIRVEGLGMRRGRPSLQALLRLRRLLRRERPDLLQSWLHHADFLALLGVAGLARLPLLWNLRCSALDIDIARPSRQLQAVRRILAWTSRRPAAVIANSEAGQRFHAALGYAPRRWEIVPNGFDTGLFRPDPALRAQGRARLGLDAIQPLIGMVARVDPMKDHASFLAAAAQVAKGRPEVRFALIGQGTEALAVPPALDGRLQALGECSHVEEILPALDINVLASFGEGFPNVLGEAMACGVPCIASDVGDARAIIGETGAIVPPRDPAALAAAMLALLARSVSDRAALGEAARRRVVDRYSIAAAVERYERLYAEIAGAARRGQG